MNSYYILDKHDKPVPVDRKEWARWFETADRPLKITKIGDVRISTIFLGIDYSWDYGPHPILWQTVIFGGLHGGYEDRYRTREQALAGHARAVEMVKATGKESD